VPERFESPSDEPLRQNRDFSTLLVSQSVSVVGDAVSATALPLLVFALTGSGLVMGIVGAVGSLIGGVLIDTVGGTNTLAILGGSICILAFGFSQVRALRAASLAPPHLRPPEPFLPISDGLER
jgi:hypothetical protein